MDADSTKTISFRISRVLDDVGVTGCMIGLRRRRYLQREAVETVAGGATGQKVEIFHFGSQTEGSTTPELGSDLDTLLSFRDWEVLTSWKEWKAGQLSLMMVKDENSPPRHCSLQLLRPDLPFTRVPESEILRDTVSDTSGRILLKYCFFDTWLEREWRRMGKTYVKNGPSGSGYDNFDLVIGFRSRNLPEECKTWLRRPRLNHWPTQELFDTCCRSGTFVVPIGHPESQNRQTEWRFSTSEIERHLMFSLNVVQIKTYILLKMLKRQFFKPIAGDGLSSFHCKCALLFTVENTPPAFWREDKLLLCLLQCLRQLQRWIDAKFCPHYVIDSMNLFVGKLFNHHFHHLSKIIREIIKDPINHLCRIEPEQFGKRLMTLSKLGHYKHGQFITRFEKHTEIARNLVFEMAISSWSVEDYFYHLRKTPPTEAMEAFTNIKQYLVTTQSKGNYFQAKVAEITLPHICGTLASIQASYCIEHKKPIPKETYDLYALSFDNDVCSNRLKFASMCYCRGDLHMAADILEQVEKKYDSQVFGICRCRETGTVHCEVWPPEPFTPTDKEILTNSVAYCVMFLRAESACVPEHLVAEMHRSTEEDIKERVPNREDWMDMACMDSLPFLFYLQYLTYLGLEYNTQKLTALRDLLKLIERGSVDVTDGHFETSYNMLGHCLELEGLTTSALAMYEQSLKNVPKNNAAKVHVSRIVKQSAKT